MLLFLLLALTYGMQDKKRINDGIKYGMLYTIIIMAVGAVCFEIFAPNIIGVFRVSEETQRLCILAMRIIAVGYLFVGANIAYQGIFQALGYGIHSLIVSLIRLIIIPLPLAFILTGSQNSSNIIWVSFPVAEGIACLVALFMMNKIAKEKKLK